MNQIQVICDDDLRVSVRSKCLLLYSNDHISLGIKSLNNLRCFFDFADFSQQTDFTFHYIYNMHHLKETLATNRSL